MDRSAHCRACQAPTSGAGYVKLPGYIRGGSLLCLSCADKQGTKYHSHLLHEWVSRYVRDQRVETPVKALQAEVRELRALLDQLTKPEP